MIFGCLENVFEFIGETARRGPADLS